jgi:hypothetical protein
MCWHLDIGLKLIAHQILAQNERVDKTKFTWPKTGLSVLHTVK